jgi:acyl-CoA synthetase (AMP-forming)/AMP-acid ligase II
MLVARLCGVRGLVDTPLTRQMKMPEKASRIAVVCAHGRTTYAELLQRARGVAASLPPRCHVALLCEPGVAYVSGMLGVWKSGGVVVPVATTHPDGEIEYVVSDGSVKVLLADQTHISTARRVASKLAVPCLQVEELYSKGDTRSASTEVDPSNGATMMYTSGVWTVLHVSDGVCVWR